MFDLYNKSKLKCTDLALYAIGAILLYIVFFISAVLI